MVQNGSRGIDKEAKSMVFALFLQLSPRFVFLALRNGAKSFKLFTISRAMEMLDIKLLERLAPQTA